MSKTKTKPKFRKHSFLCPKYARNVLYFSIFGQNSIILTLLAGALFLRQNIQNKNPFANG